MHFSATLDANMLLSFLAEALKKDVLLHEDGKICFSYLGENKNKVDVYPKTGYHLSSLNYFLTKHKAFKQYGFILVESKTKKKKV